MADQQPIFDITLSGTNTVATEKWVDLGVITSGKQIVLGFATYIAEDKNCQFETRSNTAGKSAGTVGDTELLDWTSTQQGTSVDRDFYQNGYINTVTIVGTGTEHWWLRVRAQSSAVGTFDYIIRYMVQ